MEACSSGQRSAAAYKIALPKQEDCTGRCHCYFLMALELKYAAKELCILRRAKLKSLLEVGLTPRLIGASCSTERETATRGRAEQHGAGGSEGF
eukprot:4557621-Pyramimonas_sp.AAC.1